MWPFDALHNFIDPFVANFDGFFDSLSDSDFVQNYANSDFTIPIVESLHVLAVGLVVGTIFFVDLRLMGFFRSMSVRRAEKIVPYTWWAFLLAVVTGTIFFLQQPTRYIHNEAFQIKFLLLALAGINLAIFHFGVWQRADQWDDGRRPPAAARTAGIVSAVLWIGVIFYGRLVPFVGG
jgi:hypothetical protein